MTLAIILLCIMGACIAGMVLGVIEDKLENRKEDNNGRTEDPFR